MSTLDDDYADRLAELLEDMEGDGVDGINIIMNYLMAYVEGICEGEEEKGLIWQLGDKDLVISIEPASEHNLARLH